MNLIIDASVAIKWFIPEPHWQQADKLRRLDTCDFHAPDFLLLELTSVLTKKVHRGELTRDDANVIQQLLPNMPLQLHPWQSLLIDASQIALLTHRAVYDCLYLQLARLLDGRMVTADGKLFRALQDDPQWREHLLWIEAL